MPQTDSSQKPSWTIGSHAPSPTVQMLQELQRISAGEYSLQAAARGNALYCRLDAQWERDYGAADHPGWQTPTYACFSNDLARLREAGGTVWSQLLQARAEYEAWHQRCAESLLHAGASQP